MMTDCDHVANAVRAGVLKGIHADHAAECVACGLLLANDAALGRALAGQPQVTGGDEALAARIMDGVRADRAPRLTTRARQVLVGSLFLAPVLAGATLWTGRSVSGAFALTLVAAFGGAMVLRPVHRPAPMGWLPRLVVLLGVPALMAVIWPFAGGPLPAVFVVATVGCFIKGSIVAGIVSTGVIATDRRTVLPLDGLAAAVALGALSAGAALELSCPMDHSAHRLLGHAAVGIALSLLLVAAAALWREQRAPGRRAPSSG